MQKQEAINELIKYVLRSEKESIEENTKRGNAELKKVSKKISKKLDELSENIIKE